MTNRTIRNFLLSAFEIELLRNAETIPISRTWIRTDMDPILRTAMYTVFAECFEAVQAHPDWDYDDGRAFCEDPDSSPRNTAIKLLVWWRLKRGLHLRHVK